MTKVFGIKLHLNKVEMKNFPSNFLENVKKNYRVLASISLIFVKQKFKPVFDSVNFVSPQALFSVIDLSRLAFYLSSEK